MKHHSILRNTLSLLLASVFLFIVSACVQNSSSIPATTGTSPTPSAKVTANPEFIECWFLSKRGNELQL